MPFFGSQIPMEFVMYGAIGFCAAWLMALAFVPVVHNRAQRLLRKHIDDQPSVKQMQAEKDQIRAGFAAATRDLEFRMERLREMSATYASEASRAAKQAERLQQEAKSLKAALADAHAREHIARSEVDALRRELAQKDAALDAAGQEIAAIKAEIARIAPQLFATPRAPEVVPLAPTQQPRDLPERPKPAAPVRRLRDESVARAWAEIAETARRIDAGEASGARRYTPLFRPSR